MGLFSKTVKQDDTLFTTVSSNLTENSELIKNVINSSKKAIVPVSKMIDYLAVSAVAIVLYNLTKLYL